MLVSGSASTQDTGMKIYNRWNCTKYYRNRKNYGLTTSVDMKVSEQCGIAVSKGNYCIN